MQILKCVITLRNTAQLSHTLLSDQCTLVACIAMHAFFLPTPLVDLCRTHSVALCKCMASRPCITWLRTNSHTMHPCESISGGWQSLCDRVIHFFICSSGLVMYLLTYHKEVLGPLITRDDFHHLCNHSQSRPWCKSLDLHWRWDTFICVAVIGPELSGAMSGVHGLTSCDIHSHGCFVWLLLVQSYVTQCQSSIHSHGAT